MTATTKTRLTAFLSRLAAPRIEQVQACSEVWGYSNGNVLKVVLFHDEYLYINNGATCVWMNYLLDPPGTRSRNRGKSSPVSHDPSIVDVLTEVSLSWVITELFSFFILVSFDGRQLYELSVELQTADTVDTVACLELVEIKNRGKRKWKLTVHLSSGHIVVTRITSVLERTFFGTLLLLVIKIKRYHQSMTPLKFTHTADFICGKLTDRKNTYLHLVIQVQKTAVALIYIQYQELSSAVQYTYSYTILQCSCSSLFGRRGTMFLYIRQSSFSARSKHPAPTTM